MSLTTWNSIRNLIIGISFGMIISHIIFHAMGVYR